MRDMRRIQERATFSFERPYTVWLTLGSLVLLCLVFAGGFVVGARYERLELQLSRETHSLARLSKESRRHRELTFYSDLNQKERAKATRAPKESVSDGRGSSNKTKEQALVQIRNSLGQSRNGEKSKEKVVARSQAPKKSQRGPRGDEAEKGLENGPARSGEYTIQVSSYQTLEEAKAYSSVLERKGYRPFVVAAEIKGKGTWYRVRVGRFIAENVAIRAKQILANADIPAWVLKME